MNTGAFGENFPYTNFHDLNTDWIVKIVKDFLDQYTHIQETIDNGLEELETKATELETLLQEWYDTHSEDIANQLADALNDLNSWYNTHQNYLDQYVTNTISEFTATANRIASETIETIPQDYSDFYSDFQFLEEQYFDSMGFLWGRTLSTISGSTWTQQVSGYSFFMKVKPSSVYTFKNTNGSMYCAVLQSLTNIDTPSGAVDFSATYPSLITVSANTFKTLTMPNDAKYLWFYGNEPGRTDNKYKPTVMYIDNYTESEDIMYNLQAIRNNILEATKTIFSPEYCKLRFTNMSITSGYFVSNSTGVLVENADYRATDYIPIFSKYIAISRGVAQFAYYDYNKNYIDGVAVTTTAHDLSVYQIPSSARYVRLSLAEEAYFELQNMYMILFDGQNTPLNNDWLIVDKYNAGLCPDFINLRNAIEFATQYKNTKLLIKSGTYDVLSDFATEIQASPSSQIGYGLGNGIHIYAESGVFINCLYNGSDTNVITNLSPFYTLFIDGGFTLENVEIHSSNCRYCVHDEYSGHDNTTYNKYLNCRFNHNDEGAGALSGYYPQW